MRLRRLVPLTQPASGSSSPVERRGGGERGDQHVAEPASLGTPALVLDARGQRCPLPVILLARRISEVAVGDLVAVVADDPAARVDVPAWCRLRGQQFVAEEPSPDGVPVYLVRRLG